MKVLRSVLVLGLVFMFSASITGAQELTDVQLGENLLAQLWNAIKANDIELLDELLAPGFQSVHSDGARNRAEEIKLLKSLDIDDYKLSDINITRNGNVMVATYFIAVEETIKGKRLSKVPAPRLSVFLKNKGSWKWLAHANLKPVK